MRWLGSLVLAVVVGSAAGQTEAMTAPLQHGRLVIWVVRPAAKGWSPERAATALALGPGALPKTVQEQTAGSFGTASSNVGTAASDYGQTASSLGQTASTFGHAASEHGQTAGSYGTASSNVGQTAGSYGQTAGSFGESNGTVATAAERRNNRSQWIRRIAASRWEAALRGAFPELNVVTYEVREEDMNAALRMAAGMPDAPDVLVGNPVLPTRWARDAKGTLTDAIVMPNTQKAFPAQVVPAVGVQGGAACVDTDRDYAVVLAAPRPDAAMAFAVWMNGQSGCEDPPLKDALPGDGAVVGLNVAQALVKGGSYGAEFDREATRIAAGRFATTGLEVAQTVTRSAGSHVLRAVGVKTLLVGAHEVRVLHTLVVLRRDTVDQPWRILQITPDMSGAMLREAVEAIGGGAMGRPSGAKIEAVSLASPLDGEVKLATPDLWWDNKGGAKLEVVEWGPSGLGTRLFLVKDVDGIAKTRVPAAFATGAGAYRWRVWSVAAGGAVVMTGWRTMVVSP